MPIKLEMRPLLIFILSTTCAAQTLVPPEDKVLASSTSSQSNSGDRSPQKRNQDLVKYVAPSWWPHPYVEFGGAAFLRPTGSKPVAALGQVGVDLERSPWMAEAHFSADNHKVYPQHEFVDKPTGHNFYLSVSAYRRIPDHMNWFVGGGWERNHIWTTDFSAAGASPFVGGGYDLLRKYRGENRECFSHYCDTSIRLTLHYFSARTVQSNERGIDFGCIMPRPTEKRHLFIVVDMAAFWGRVGDFDNPSAVFGYKTSMGVVYRFH